MIRPARPEELSALNALMLRSKAHWGYDDAFMAACVPVLRLTERDLTDGNVAVYGDEKAFGVCKLVTTGKDAVLDKLFVAPDAMGLGAGRALMMWAAARARNKGAIVMRIEADPEAAPFYEKMGARIVGQVSSEAIEGRMLPLLQLDLQDLAAAPDKSI